MKNVEVLAFGAHPDDVELSCSGTLMGITAKGKEAVICDLTQGELGTRGTVETRYQEAEAASQIMGISDRLNLKMADGFFSGDQDEQREIIRVIRHYRPRIVLCNAVSDRHPDHGRAGELVTRCCFLAGLRKIGTMFDGEQQQAYRPHVVYHYIQDRLMDPDLVVNITPHFQKKMDAVKAYKTQFYDPESKEPVTPISGSEFFEFITGRALHFGRLGGFQYGEGFTTERPVALESIELAV